MKIWIKLNLLVNGLVACSAPNQASSALLSDLQIGQKLTANSLYTSVIASFHGSANGIRPRFHFQTFASLYEDMAKNAGSAAIDVDGHIQHNPRQALLSHKAMFAALDQQYGSVDAFLDIVATDRNTTYASSAAFGKALHASIDAQNAGPALALEGPAPQLGPNINAPGATANQCAVFQAGWLQCRDSFSAAITTYNNKYNTLSTSQQVSYQGQMATDAMACYDGDTQHHWAGAANHDAGGLSYDGENLANCGTTPPVDPVDPNNYKQAGAAQAAPGASGQTTVGFGLE